jgi:6-phosphogluconate dehydrogenase (decarboxylating)
MQIGMVGLGRMGENMARRLMRGGHEVVAFATAAAAVKQLASEGAIATTTLDDFVAKLRAPRVAWVMVPAGAATEQVVSDLAAGMEWLLDLTAQALTENPSLSEYTGIVQDSGEGRWTITAVIEEGVPADVLSAALYVRFRSRQEHTFAEKVLSAMRHKFGGHVEQPTGG